MEEALDWQRTASIVVVGIVTFVGDASRGILFPALWPLCEKLGGNKVLLGYLVATFSVGRLVISTRLGIIADVHGHRTALMLSGIILVAGAAIWANSPFMGGLAMLFIAQFTLGLGTGSLGVTRSYIVEQTEPKNRTYIMARLSALQYGGFAATPILGSVFVLMGQQLSSYWKYAFPAYLLLVIAIATLCSIYYPFRDFDDEDEQQQQKDSLREPSGVSSSASTEKVFNPVNKLTRFSDSINPMVSDEAALSYNYSADSARSSDARSSRYSMPHDAIWGQRISVAGPIAGLGGENDVDDDDDAMGELVGFWGTQAYEESRLTNTQRHSQTRHSHTPKPRQSQDVETPAASVDRSLGSLASISSLSPMHQPTVSMNIQMQDMGTHGSHAHTQALVAALDKEEANDRENDKDEHKDDKLSKEVANVSTQSALTPTADSILRERTYVLMMWLNFTTRGVIAIMETQASQILLSHYNMSEIRLGVYVSFAGTVGTLNLLFFKNFWCKYFTDYELLVGGLIVLGLSQSLAITWGPDEGHKAMWRFTSALFIVYGIGYPVGNSAVLGIFSSLQKTGKQAKAQGRFAFMGSLARVLCPIISGYMELYIEEGAAFGFACILMAISLIAVMVIAPERLWITAAPPPPAPIPVAAADEKMSFSTPSPSLSSPSSPSPSMSAISLSAPSPAPAAPVSPAAALVQRPILTTTKAIIILGALAAMTAAIGAMCDWGVSEW